MKTTVAIVSLLMLVLDAGAVWCADRWPLSVALTQPTSARVTSVYDVEDIVDTGPSGLKLVMDGRDDRDVRVTVQARLPSSFRLERMAHRRFKYWPRGRDWTYCWRVVHDDGSGSPFVAGCVRRDVYGNNHVQPDATEVALSIWYDDVDVSSQELTFYRPGHWMPVPKTMPATTSWADLKFHLPLPLARHTTVDAMRAIRARGGTVVNGSGPVDVVVLPDWADYCIFDRLSRATEPLRWLRRGVPIVWERSLDWNTNNAARRVENRPLGE